MSTTIQTKLIIVGGGPAGLTAAIYAARAGLEPIVATGGLTSTQMPGGQLMITTEVENFPGFPSGITGPELVDQMKQQAENFGAVFIDEFAHDFKLMMEKPKKNFKHQLYIGDQLYETDVIILANGARARWLGAENEEKYINKGISACATCDAGLPYFRNQVIAVVGGGDSACEEALFITRFASNVVLIHRRDKLRASKIMADRVLKHPKITVLWNTQIVGYYGDEDGNLKGVKLITDDDEKQIMDCRGVFMAIGHIPNTESLVDSGISLNNEGYIEVHNNVYTDIPGVFVAGDCADKIYRQAITASGFGCMASIAAERWLSENENK